MRIGPSWEERIMVTVAQSRSTRVQVASRAQNDAEMLARSKHANPSGTYCAKQVLVRQTRQTSRGLASPPCLIDPHSTARNLVGRAIEAYSSTCNAPPKEMTRTSKKVWKSEKQCKFCRWKLRTFAARPDNSNSCRTSRNAGDEISPVCVCCEYVGP